ncbi:hypothetical protein QVD99_008062 [Batrachochytrium dendrobatidis]|nr:hypothetical protein O5D80_004784 [Batrachochytrium dendrobatidis]KAK5665217.1 hypothetical protein QVD99_008062 [Batrachochytrium dendrobatidis]
MADLNRPTESSLSSLNHMDENGQQQTLRHSVAALSRRFEQINLVKTEDHPSTVASLFAGHSESVTITHPSGLLSSRPFHNSSSANAFNSIELENTQTNCHLASSQPSSLSQTPSSLETSSATAFPSQLSAPYPTNTHSRSVSTPRLRTAGAVRVGSTQPIFPSNQASNSPRTRHPSHNETDSVQKKRLSVSRISRMFEQQANINDGISIRSPKSVGANSTARRNLTAPSTRNGSFVMPPFSTSISQSDLRPSRSLKPPPPKPPKPCALAAPAVASFNSSPQSTILPASPGQNPFSDSSGRLSDSTPPKPYIHNNSVSDLQTFIPSQQSQANVPTNFEPNYDDESSDRPISMASLDIQNRLAVLSSMGASFTSPSHHRPTHGFVSQHSASHSQLPTDAKLSFHHSNPVRPVTPLRPKSLQQRESVATRLYYDDAGEDSNVAIQEESVAGNGMCYLDPNVGKLLEINRDASYHSFTTQSSSGEDNQLLETEAKRAYKWTKIVEEIVETERTYLSDMHVLHSVYVLPSLQSGVLPATDHKLLFGHLENVIATSTVFLKELEAAANAHPQTMGEAFMRMIHSIEVTYCNYCKHNEAAVLKLSDYASPTCPESIKLFLETCRGQLQGKTGAWDLASLIVKPVQRVLKYPLLIKSLIKEMEPNHPDGENLLKSFDSMSLVAEKINEVKKRKDIVEKYVDGKGKINVMHGITKMIGRGTQQLKKKTGLTDETTSDAVYDALVEKFTKQHEAIVQLRIEISAWLKSMKEYVEYEEGMAVCLDDLYYIDSIPANSIAGPDEIDYLGLIKRYRSTCGRLITGPYRDAESQIKLVMIPAVEQLLNHFKAPLLVMRKRDAKLLDYDRANSMRAKGDVVDKLLAESAGTYSSINAQLTEELPLFMNFVTDYIHEILIQVIIVQRDMYQNIRQIVVPLADALQISVHETTEDILKKFREHMRVGGPIEVATKNILLLHQWRSQIWGYDDNAHEAAMRLFDSPERKTGSLSNFSGSSGLARDDATSFNNMPLVDLTGSAPAPRQLRMDVDTDAILRHNMLVTHSTLAPTIASISTHQTNSIQGERDINCNSESAQDPYATDPFEAVAIYPFASEFDDEVSLVPGMVVSVYRTGGRDETGDDWWYGEVVSNKHSGNTFGWFPRSFVEY